MKKNQTPINTILFYLGLLVEVVVDGRDAGHEGEADAGDEVEGFASETVDEGEGDQAEDDHYPGEHHDGDLALPEGVTRQGRRSVRQDAADPAGTLQEPLHQDDDQTSSVTLEENERKEKFLTCAHVIFF